MKVIFASILFALLSCLPANAQKSSDINTMLLYSSYNLETTKLQSDTAKSVVVNESYKDDPEYQSGQKLRRAGMITTGAGVTWGLVCGGIAIYGNNSDEFLDELGGAVFGRLALISIPVIGTGVTMWLRGSNKIKKVKAASSGLGLAYTF